MSIFPSKKQSCSERDFQNQTKIAVSMKRLGGGGGGVFTSKRLLGMCRWMGSHFRNWTDYNGAIFLVVLLEWGRKFSGFLG